MATPYKISSQESALAKVPTVAAFELSFNLLLSKQENVWFDPDGQTGDYGIREVINIKDPDNARVSQPRVDMVGGSGVQQLVVTWTQGTWIPGTPWFGTQGTSTGMMIPTEMVTGGTYDIKIRVKSGIMKVYIDGCLKTEFDVDVTEAQDQMFYAASPTSNDDGWIETGGYRQFWLDGELSNIRYFSIGDYCSAVSDNERCECSDGFSGAICQDVA